MEKRGPGAPPGNENRLVHGGRRAITALGQGEPLRGVAAELAADVAAELAADGTVATMWQTAIDHLAVARLYLGLILAETDVIVLDTWIKRFGWLNSKAFNMLRDLAKMEQGVGGGVVDYEAILAEKARNGNPDR